VIGAPPESDSPPESYTPLADAPPESKAPRATAVARGGRRTWLIYGIAFAVALWFAPTFYGALALLVLVAGAFVLARRVGTAQIWIATAVVGIAMTSLLGWAASTDARCPAAGERVTLKEGKAPVSCDEIRAGYLSMAVFFAVLGLGSLAWGRASRTAAP